MPRLTTISLLLLALVIGTSGRARQTEMQSFKLKLTSHRLPLSRGPLEVDLKGLPSKMDWAIGVSVKKGQPAGVEFAVLRYCKDCGPMGQVFPQGGENLPTGSLAISPGRVLVNDLHNYEGQKLLGLVFLPRPTTVRLKVDGSLIAGVAPSAGFMVHDGQVLKKPPRSFLSVLQLLSGLNSPHPLPFD